MYWARIFTDGLSVAPFVGDAVSVIRPFPSDMKFGEASSISHRGLQPVAPVQSLSFT